MTGGFSPEALIEYQRQMAEVLGDSHDFTECVDVFDFRLCQRPNRTYYGTAGQCRQGVEVDRKDVVKEIETIRGKITPQQRKAIEKLGDEDLGRVYNAVKHHGTDLESAHRVATAVGRLASETESGAKKKGGDNLQDPGEAAKYAKFYEEGRDKTHKAPHDHSKEEVNAVLAELKDSLEPKEYRAIVKALSNKGSPTSEQLIQAGWTNKEERGRAVLKSLMDNEFKDVNGQFLSWRQGLQLDHRKAGAVGGSDRPDNWIWISTATNQTKGGVENVVKKEITSGKLEAKDADRRISELLISKLHENAKMSPEAVAKAKETGSMAVLKKAEAAQAYRDDLPLMTRDQRREKIEAAKGSTLKTLMKASTTTEDGGGYRPVVSGGPGQRTRSSYPSAASIKSLLKARWGLELSSADLKNIADIINESTGSSKSNDVLLSDLLEKKFIPAVPLTSEQMKEIRGHIDRVPYEKVRL